MTRRYEVVRQTSHSPDGTVTPPPWLGWLVQRSDFAAFVYSSWLGNREQERGVFYTSRPVQTETDQPEAVET